MVFKDKYGINHYFSLDYRPERKFIYYPPWDNGKERTIISKGTAVRNRDPYDILFDLHCKAGERGIVNKAFIDGKGVLHGTGTAWRIHFYYEDLRRQFYNIDFTVYVKFLKAFTTGDARVITRLGTLSNHFLEHKCGCSGTGMYTETKLNRVEQLKKELYHEKSGAIPGYCPDYVLNRKCDIGLNKWVGHRNVSIHTNQGLLLIYYKDYSGGVNGGDWHSVGMRLDKGDWGLTGEARDHFPDVNDICDFQPKIRKVASPDEIIKSGYGNYLRFDNMEDIEFKNLSIFELRPQT